MRDHNPVKIEEFNGIFARGDKDSTPFDHFTDCNNIQYSESSYLTRDGIDVYLPYKNIVRLYTFNQSLLILDIDGNIYHSDRGGSSLLPILSIPGMTDFGFVKFANRAYITPVGMSNQFIYVYRYGDAAGARKAAGNPPSTAPVPTLGPAGNTEQGVHIFKVFYETDTGFLTGLSPGAELTLVDGTKSVNLTIPVSPNSFVTKRHVAATKAIDIAVFTGDLNNYEFFKVPNGTVADNTTTTVNINFYDAELLEDASYLDDLFSEIPNCGGLNLYHGRLVAWNFPQGSVGENISTIRVSNQGDPESINQIDGLILIPRDGLSITYCQEQRDILYIFKVTKTNACTDNGDVPSSWPIIVIDQGIGCTPHGLATIMDSGGVNIDYLLVADFTGLVLFTGTYQFPELSWKIENLWPNSNRSLFIQLQVVVESQEKKIYVVLPDGTMLVGDYRWGLTADKIKWEKWSTSVLITCITIVEDNTVKLIIGSKNT